MTSMPPDVTFVLFMPDAEACRQGLELERI